VNSGLPTPDHFDVRATSLDLTDAALPDGAIVVRAHALSVDPYVTRFLIFLHFTQWPFSLLRRRSYPPSLREHAVSLRDVVFPFHRGPLAPSFSFSFSLGSFVGRGTTRRYDFP
jgi:hypothetical protein